MLKFAAIFGKMENGCDLAGKISSILLVSERKNGESFLWKKEGDRRDFEYFLYTNPNALQRRFVV